MIILFFYHVFSVIKYLKICLLVEKYSVIKVFRCVIFLITSFIL